MRTSLGNSTAYPNLYSTFSTELAGPQSAQCPGWLPVTASARQAWRGAWLPPPWRNMIRKFTCNSSSCLQHQQGRRKVLKSGGINQNLTPGWDGANWNAKMWECPMWGCTPGTPFFYMPDLSLLPTPGTVQGSGQTWPFSYSSAFKHDTVQKWMKITKHRPCCFK